MLRRLLQALFRILPGKAIALSGIAVAGQAYYAMGRGECLKIKYQVVGPGGFAVPLSYAGDECK